MDKIKVIRNLIIFLAILIVCIISIIAFVEYKKEEEIEEYNPITEGEEEIIEMTLEEYEDWWGENITLKHISNRNDYFTIKNILENYYEHISYLQKNNNLNVEELEKLLDKVYIQSCIKNNELNIELVNNIEIEKIYLYEKSENIKLYLVNAIFNNDSESSMIIAIDSINDTFSIFLQDYIDKYQISEEKTDYLNNIDIDYIERNEYNVVEYKNIQDDTYVKYLFEDYIEKALYKTDNVYENIVNKQYKDIKFGSKEQYKKYIEENRKILELYDAKNMKQYGDFESYEEWDRYISTTKLLEVDKYLIEEREGYTEYTIIDTYGNYYIFNEKSVMNYEVILDTYTIDLPEFLEKYNEADEQEKVEMNISRVLEAIREEDYNYVYQKLYESFKLQYFSTLEEFEEYAKNRLIHDEINFKDYSDLDGIYNYVVELQNGDNLKEITFSVQLLEGTDYRISFNIN